MFYKSQNKIWKPINLEFIIFDKNKNILKIDDKYLYYNVYVSKSNGKKLGDVLIIIERKNL